MPTNLLLLPLLGGFWFVHFCYFFRFRAQRLDGYRLLLESAFFGLLLLVPARLITYYAQYLELGRRAQAEWGKLWNAPLSGTATLSLLLGLVVPLIINWLHATNRRLQSEAEVDEPMEPVSRFLLLAKDHALEMAIKSTGTYLHQLLLKAVLQKTPTLVTLQNRKVYVGYIAELPNLKPENQYIRLLPAFSGHRDDKSLEVRFDLVYPDPKGMPKETTITEEDMLLTIPLSEVKSLTLYHQKLRSFILPYPPERTPSEA